MFGSRSEMPLCPKCNSKSVIPIMYGHPSKKLKKDHEKGRIHHHGCVIYDGMPEWHCKQCGNEWGEIKL